MTVVATRTDTAAPIEITIDQGGGVTGLTVTIAVRDAQTDGSWLDFNDDTFKTAGWTTRQASLAEVDSSNAPGAYRLTAGLNLLAIPNLPANTDNLMLEFEVSGDITANLIDQMQLVSNFYTGGVVYDGYDTPDPPTNTVATPARTTLNHATAGGAGPGTVTFSAAVKTLVVSVERRLIELSIDGGSTHIVMYPGTHVIPVGFVTALDIIGEGTWTVTGLLRSNS